MITTNHEISTLKITSKLFSNYPLNKGNGCLPIYLLFCGYFKICLI